MTSVQRVSNFSSAKYFKLDTLQFELWVLQTSLPVCRHTSEHKGLEMNFSSLAYVNFQVYYTHFPSQMYTQLLFYNSATGDSAECPCCLGVLLLHHEHTPRVLSFTSFLHSINKPKKPSWDNLNLLLLLIVAYSFEGRSHLPKKSWLNMPCLIGCTAQDCSSSWWGPEITESYLSLTSPKGISMCMSLKQHLTRLKKQQCRISHSFIINLVKISELNSCPSLS